MSLSRLHDTVAAVCPIDGVSVAAGPPRSVRVDYADSATPEQRAAADAAVAAFDWSDAAEAVWRVGRMRQDAGSAALTNADGTSVANRAAEAQGTTRDNDLAEMLAVIRDHLGLTAADVAALIADRRQTVPAPVGAPAPADVVSSATSRLEAPAIAQAVGALIAEGAGDPLA